MKIITKVVLVFVVLVSVSQADIVCKPIWGGGTQCIETPCSGWNCR